MAAMIQLGVTRNTQTRQRGNRYPNDLYKCSRKMGKMLSKLHIFRDAADSDAKFPLIELHESLELLKSPSLFGGPRGFAEPLPADKSAITSTENFDIDIPNIDAGNLNIATAFADHRNNQIKKKEEAMEATLDLSTKYNINEKIAVNYWLDANDSAIQLELVTHFGSQPSDREAADHLYCMDRNHLIEVIILLMKMRENNDNTSQLSPDKHIAVMSFTNQLLKEGSDSMVKILLSVIKMDGKNFFNNTISKSILSTLTSHLQKLALAVFHACYQLQVNLAEEQELLRVLKALTKDIVDEESDRDEKDKQAIQKGLHSALVILQITYIHIFRSDMFVVRPDQEDQEPSGNFMRDSAYENILSRVLSGPEMKRKMENGKQVCIFRDIDQSNEEYWPQSSLGSNGLIYLAYGRLEYYVQDNSRIDRVIDLFHEANQRRAYSYIRLCIIPILQDKKSGDSMNDSYALLTKVLKHFLWELSIIFSDEEYANEPGVLDQDSFPFFNLVRDPVDHVAVKKGLGAAQLPIGQSDTFVDVTLLYAAFIAAYPSFAVQYISSNADARPFLDKVVQGTHHPKMERAAFHLLTALASSPYKIDDEFAPKKVFDIIKRGNAPVHFRWEHFAKSLSDLAHIAGKVPENPNHAARARLSAASSWAELEPGRALRGTDGWNEGQMSRDLTDDEENYIVSITELYAAIASQPRSLHLEEAIRPDLVNTFFKLLACPLSIRTKGSVFRALAAYSRNCNDEYSVQEIWRLLIQNRLLPIPETLVPMSDEGYKQGLRAELEDTESRAGLYSISDGFLLLLDSLLSHGIPDAQSGTAGGTIGAFIARKQDILVYLDYVIEDILGNVNKRYYNDAHNPQQSSAQKWRIYARCLKVLSTILQHYSINLLGGQHSDDASKDAILLDDKSRIHDLQSDFLEDDFSRSTTTQNFSNALVPHGLRTNENDYSNRIKSPGFMIMTMLLNHSSLQESLMGLLRLSGYEKVLETDRKNKVRAAFSAVEVMYDGRTTDRGYLVNSCGTDNLDMRGFDDGVFDSAYWHVKAISAMTGLLYECVLRERSFMDCVKMSPHITMIFTRRGKWTQQPVGTVNSLANAFARYKFENSNGSALAYVALLLQFPNNVCTSVPSIPMMASYIMKTFANDSSSSESLIGSAVFHNIGGYDLVRGCSHIIQEGDVPLGGEVFPSGLYSLGADILPDIYSENARARLPYEAPKISRAIDRVKAAKRRLYSPRSFHYYYEDDESFESISDTLLDLLLTTLAPRSLCFAHILLGLDRIVSPRNIRPSSNTDHPLCAGDGIKNPDEFPVTCLEAVLFILNDAVNLVLHNSDRAMLCYELIYRLCAAPLTNLIVLSFLRRETIGFLPKHIGYCMNLLNLTDRDILQHCDLEEEHNIGGEEEKFKERRNGCVSRVKYARLNCSAWILKICALELRALSSAIVTSTVNVDAVLTPLLSVLREGDWNRGVHITLTSMLLSAANTPDEHYPQFSDVMRRIMNFATVPLFVERGSAYSREQNPPSIIDKFMFARLCAIEGGANPNDPQYIDQTGYEQALTDITNLNRYIKYAAAAKHFCIGWNQCIGIALYLHKIDLGRIVQPLLLPTLLILNTPNKLEVDMPELVASAVFTMVSVLYKNTISAHDESVPISSILDQEQQRILLQGLINAAINSVHRVGTSARYCSDLIRCIGIVLTGLSGFREPSFVVSPSLREPISDEGIGKFRLVDSPWGNLQSEDDVEAYRLQTIQILEQNVCNLVDSVSREVCSGPGSSRLSAASTLQAILSVLGPTKSGDSLLAGLSTTMQTTGRFKHVLGSHAFLQALQVLVHRGYLQQLLSTVGPISSVRHFSISEAMNGNIQDDRDDRDMFISTLSICIQLSCTVEGVDMLVQHGNILQRILNLSIFCNPPPTTDDIVFSTSNSISVIDWEDKFFMVIRLLRVMCATAPTRDILEPCAEFLRKNHVTVTYLLRLKHKNLFGLALVESILAIFSFIAAAPRSLLHRSSNFVAGDRVEIELGQSGILRIGRIVRIHQDTTYDIDFENGLREQCLPEATLRHCSACPSSAGILWDVIFERLADSFTADICGVLNLLGIFPFPSEIFMRMGNADANTWWDRIQATKNDGDRLIAFSRDYAKGNAALGMLSKWTQFDHIKADYALNILVHASTCLRVRASVLIDHGISRGGSGVDAAGSLSSSTVTGLLVVELVGVLDAFSTCSEIISSRVKMPLSNSDDPILSNLICIVENLVCFVHDMVVGSTTDEDFINLGSSLEIFFRLTEAYSQESLTFKVSRVTQEFIRKRTLYNRSI